MRSVETEMEDTPGTSSTWSIVNCRPCACQIVAADFKNAQAAKKLVEFRKYRDAREGVVAHKKELAGDCLAAVRREIPATTRA
jgi:hypothetical protein